MHMLAHTRIKTARSHWQDPVGLPVCLYYCFRAVRAYGRIEGQEYTEYWSAGLLTKITQLAREAGSSCLFTCNSAHVNHGDLKLPEYTHIIQISTSRLETNTME